MLNKQKSTNRNAWKYSRMIPLLGAFLFLFQEKVTAQEKTSVPQQSMINTDYSESIVVAITKDARNAELKVKRNIFKSQYNVILSFSDIKRNDNDEITSIKVSTYITGKKENKTEIVIGQDTTPITAFTIVAGKEKTSGEVVVTVGGAVPDEPKAFVLTDDKFVTYERGTLPPKETLNTVNDTLMLTRGAGNPTQIMTTTTSTYKGDKNSVAPDLADAGIDHTKAYIIINDKEATAADYGKLDPKTINRTIISTGNGTIKKYGEKGRNGVVIIETKGFESALFGQDTNLNNVNLVTDVTYYITKTTTDKNLELYVKMLAEKSIEMTYSQIERNKNGEITSINLNLKDIKGSSTASSAWNTGRNKAGIPDIAIGRKNNRIIAVTSFK